jgi:hypothetical protein
MQPAGHLRVTSAAYRRVPTVTEGGTMSTSTRTTGTMRPTTRPTTWVCDNCSRETRAGRKRCADCGTSRY